MPPAPRARPSSTISPVAIIGGTGKLGMGLATRLARSKVGVIIGSRDTAKATIAATTIGAGARGASNRDAATAGAIIVIAVPYQAHRETLTAIAEGTAGKVVVDAAVPLIMQPIPRVERPSAGSLAAEAAQALPAARIVAAFHTVSAGMLAEASRQLHGDVLFCGDDARAKDAAAALIRAVGMRPVDAGPLAEAHTLEQLAGLLLALNKRYRQRDLGITVAGLD